MVLLTVGFIMPLPEIPVTPMMLEVDLGLHLMVSREFGTKLIEFNIASCVDSENVHLII